MRIAFHTPLNLFADRSHSGDRRMARQLAAVLDGLGHAVEPIGPARCYMRTPDPALLDAHLQEADRLSHTLLARWREAGTAPALWFTYHSYYKAPDLLGPTLSRELGIPYIVAEASDSARRVDGTWTRHVALAREALAAADLHLCFTARDRAGLEAFCGSEAAIVDLPPFLAPAERPQHARPHDGGAPVRLICVAMMREGGKFESYRLLAETLARLLHLSWTLTIIGDGPMREAIEALFAALLPDRVSWRGLIPNDAVSAELAAHDLFVWPGYREAYGLVYLEAQAAGLPVVAFDSGGVPATVRIGETALLVREADTAALAEAMARLISNPALRQSMGARAAHFIRAERLSANAAVILDAALARVGSARGAAA